MAAEHPWALVAPWYRWPRPGDGRFGRQSVPVLQKYAAPTFVAEFLAEPQRSLVPQDEDYVHTVEHRTPKPKFSLSPLVRVKTERRKVFLDTHSRFYLVVCELHCDAPGFPSVAREQVCEAGFVVRRRVAPAPPAARQALAAALDEVTTLEARLEAARALVPTSRVRGAGPAPGVFVSELRERCDEQLARLEAEHAASRQRLLALAARHGVSLELQGWVASEHAGIGAWRAVEETPAQVVEEILPFYPLIPDPAAARHSAAGRSIWFGVLPTGSSDVDAAATPRFDDRHLYEVRCFVRRHKPGCPKKPTRGDCRGELVWSRPTEVYRLASPMDLDGTSNRPVTVQLPDLRELEAQAATQPFGKGVGVRMVSPADSSLEFSVDPDDPGKAGGPSVAGASVCFFSIPLITIVATFVLKLFLPIVVFAFQLWFLLRLKFCILPSFELDAGLAGALAATPPGVDIDASLQVGIHAAFDANLGLTTSTGLKAEYAGDLNALGALARDMATDFSPSVPPDLRGDLGSPTPGTAPPAQQPLPALTAGLEYYARVEAVA